jgi:hypothetical protein
MKLIYLLIFLFIGLSTSIITVPSVEEAVKIEFNSTVKDFTYENSGGRNNILFVFIEYQGNKLIHVLLLVI